MCIYMAQGIVPFDNLADSAEKCGDVQGEMELEDVVQGVRAITLHEHNQCTCTLLHQVLWPIRKTMAVSYYRFEETTLSSFVLMVSCHRE